MKERYESHINFADEIIKSHSLIKGADIAIRKVALTSESNVTTGDVLSGALTSDVQIGSPIFLESADAKSNTTSVQDIYKEGNKVFIKTRTSVYELIKRKPKMVTTAKGSKYRYLEDGRTQRFKEVTKELHEPQDLLVFIPPWEVVGEKLVELYPDIFDEDMNDNDFIQTMLTYIHLPNKSVRVIDKEGKSLYHANDIPMGEQIFIGFLNKKNKVFDFYVPVVQDPRLSWSTFDMRQYKNDEDGLIYTERHIGNKVVAVEY